MSLPQPSESFAWTQEPWGAALRCLPLLEAAPHLFTSAPLSVSRDPDDPATAAVAASLGLTPGAIVQVHQVHGRDVVWVGEGEQPHFSGAAGEKCSCPALPAADVLATDDPSRAVAVRVADCAPILIADRHGRAVAAVHAGWRGTAVRVAQAGVEMLREHAGLDPADLVVAIGPSIRSCCYEVGPELREQFAAAGHDRQTLNRWFSRGKGDRWQLDVLRANVEQLQAVGVPETQIFDSGLCTACCADAFHSYRKRGTAAGRMMGVIRKKHER